MEIQTVCPMGSISAVLAQGKDPASGLLMGGAPAAGAGAGPAGVESGPGAGTVAPGGTPPATSTQQPGFPIGMFALVIGFLVLMMVMTGGAQRKEKKRMAQLLANLKKHDRVLTIGGIVGTVVEIRDDEIVLKVDENSNTRIRFTKSAIQQVLKPSDGAAAAPAGAEPKVEVVAGKREKVGA